MPSTSGAPMPAIQPHGGAKGTNDAATMTHDSEDADDGQRPADDSGATPCRCEHDKPPDDPEHVRPDEPDEDDRMQLVERLLEFLLRRRLAEVESDRGVQRERRPRDEEPCDAAEHAEQVSDPGRGRWRPRGGCQLPDRRHEEQRRNADRTEHDRLHDAEERGRLDVGEVRPVLRRARRHEAHDDGLGCPRDEHPDAPEPRDAVQPAPVRRVRLRPPQLLAASASVDVMIVSFRFARRSVRRSVSIALSRTGIPGRQGARLTNVDHRTPRIRRDAKEHSPWCLRWHAGLRRRHRRVAAPQLTLTFSSELASDAGATDGAVVPPGPRRRSGHPPRRTGMLQGVNKGVNK